MKIRFLNQNFVSIYHFHKLFELTGFISQRGEMNEILDVLESCALETELRSRVTCSFVWGMEQHEMVSNSV